VRFAAVIAPALLATLLVCGNAAADAVTLGDGGWSWFGDPRAVTYAGKHTRTYIGWLSRGGDVTVQSYDEDTKATATSVVHAAFQRDDHANPSLLVRSDGRIAAFYSQHNGASLLYRLSTNPEDVSSWGPEQSVHTNSAAPPGAPSRGYTYPNPIRLGDEATTYLFWRGGDYEPTFSAQADGQTTWAPARTLIQVPGQRPYVKYASNGTDTIDFAFTNAHPREAPDVNIYFARYRAGNIERADGTKIADVGTPIDPAAADKVFDGPENAWVHDVAEDSGGRPVIVFASFPSAADHRYHYARWTGSQWDVHQITPAGGSISADGNEPQYSGGITLDHEDPSHVYLSRQVGNAWEVEAWTTSDGGTSWTSQAITEGSSEKNVRPVSPRGLIPFDSDLSIIWLRGAYNSYVTYQTSLAGLLGAPPIVHPPAPPSAAGAPPAPKPALPQPPRSRPPRLHISARLVRIDRRGMGRVSIGCVAAAGDRCQVAGSVWRGRVRLGRLTGTLAGNVRNDLTLRLNRAGLRRLRRSGRLRVRLVVGRSTLRLTLAARV
jgi:hypothetical protein